MRNALYTFNLVYASESTCNCSCLCSLVKLWKSIRIWHFIVKLDQMDFFSAFYCPPPPGNVSNAKLSDFVIGNETARIGRNVTYFCVWLPHRTFTMTCQEDATWSGNATLFDCPADYDPSSEFDQWRIFYYYYNTQQSHQFTYDLVAGMMFECYLNKSLVDAQTIYETKPRLLLPKECSAVCHRDPNCQGFLLTKPSLEQRTSELFASLRPQELHNCHLFALNASVTMNDLVLEDRSRVCRHVYRDTLLSLWTTIANADKRWKNLYWNICMICDKFVNRGWGLGRLFLVKTGSSLKTEHSSQQILTYTKSTN